MLCVRSGGGEARVQSPDRCILLPAALAASGTRPLPFPRGSPDVLIADLDVRLLTADGVDALEPPLQIVAGLLQGARVVPVLTLVDVWKAGQRKRLEQGRAPRVLAPGQGEGVPGGRGCLGLTAELYWPAGQPLATWGS